MCDLARFAVAIEEGELISSETKTLMFTPTRLASGEDGPYGLGWFTERSHGVEMIWHYGYGAYSTLFLMIPSKNLTFIALANTQNLSRPFGLGLAEVSVLSSPLALEFFKEFVVRPRIGELLPEIDWSADVDTVVSQLRAIQDPELLPLYEAGLWSYRKLYGGIGASPDGVPPVADPPARVSQRLTTIPRSVSGVASGAASAGTGDCELEYGGDRALGGAMRAAG